MQVWLHLCSIYSSQNDDSAYRITLRYILWYLCMQLCSPSLPWLDHLQLDRTPCAIWPLPSVWATCRQWEEYTEDQVDQIASGVLMRYNALDLDYTVFDRVW